ncbi:hypothetical protein A3F27_00160 [Candidatus Kaiserbacteria bacterium RIFCSPHIGHO2_12_FULL_53_13]|uniref:Phosphatidic acid phosphatase type 2/haloperoxidase domain-containing protein n=1 Tax=Candidatus Kaiserbacteria bacterium RIFCSPHIGHO2_12_FULL_53_13 TaxID=1798502 RepID=A0A1F6EC61_9BACT|nr:MAG: hypothetical protein A3F27_00160 [Candidatus Kaiserbacteria bacterium RIFCSPHIGHO2_12_FULL_53_13]OGG74306.1 MAG: hypothetical protein A3A37_03225 [Candidatus Kaiserbacteria bacterium RIFCSPLOWO2_01_FULL_52_36]
MTSFITTIDSAVLQTLYSVRDPFLVHTFIWISELASVPTVIGFTATVVILLAYRKRWAIAAGLITSAYGAVVATGIIKEIVMRPRPGTEVAAYIETTSSFPSSHAVLSIAFYGFLVCMLWKNLPLRWKKAAAVSLSVLILLEGFSRLYLGIHYPSDVLAGYLLGAFLLWIGINVSRKLERR